MHLLTRPVDAGAIEPVLPLDVVPTVDADIEALVAHGADETLDVLVPIGQPKPWSNIGVAACLRGPDLVAAEANVRAMLVSAKVSP